MEITEKHTTISRLQSPSNLLLEVLTLDSNIRLLVIHMDQRSITATGTLL